MDMENLTKLQQKVLKLIPPKFIRKLQPRIRNTAATEFIPIIMAWANKYLTKYEKRYYKLAKIISLEIDPPPLNPNAYKEYEEEFINAANHNLEEFNEITIHYLKKINNKFPLDKIINSLLIMMKITKELADQPQNVNYFEFQKNVLETFLNKVIDQDKERFDIYFFDWNLKFGYLIEAYFKEMLCMRLMIKNLLEESDNSKLFQKTPYIGTILNKLGKDMEQRIIRNAVFHSDFSLEYKVNWDERLVTFKNFDEKLELSIKEFLTFYFETIQLIFTFGFALDYVHFLEIKGGNEKVLEYIRQDSYSGFDYLENLFRSYHPEKEKNTKYK